MIRKPHDFIYKNNYSWQPVNDIQEEHGLCRYWAKTGECNIITK